MTQNGLNQPGSEVTPGHIDELLEEFEPIDTLDAAVVAAAFQAAGIEAYVVSVDTPESDPTTDGQPTDTNELPTTKAWNTWDGGASSRVRLLG